jgi:diadenosine tetraphosphate (Ap4A) HIT family hydrolase
MLEKLLAGGGQASEREIAEEILSYDESQIEYYEGIVQRMVGRVLRNHGLVSRNRLSKTWSLEGFDSLTGTEIDELRSELEAKKEKFIADRANIWQHRRRSTRRVSGTLRYDILKQARFRCELCGISADERALEVDHILPKNRGGSDDPSNLQALCFSCNASKRDRDDTDFRPIRESYEDREKGCLFCEIDESRVNAENELAYAIFDGYPVTNGHALVTVRRHEPSFFSLSRPEVNSCLQLLDAMRARIREDDDSVEGFNVGINDGATAGQTIGHCHIHLIPRRRGDVENPIGGVRNVIPGAGDYTRAQ